MTGAEHDEDVMQRQSYNSRQSDANNFSDRSTQQLTRSQAEYADVSADRQSVGVRARQSDVDGRQAGSAYGSVSKYKLASHLLWHHCPRHYHHHHNHHHRHHYY